MIRFIVFPSPSRRSRRQNIAWGKGEAGPPGLADLYSSSPRSGRQTLIIQARSAARIRGLVGLAPIFPGLRATALHPGLYADARIRGLKTELRVSCRNLGNDKFFIPPGIQFGSDGGCQL